MIIFIGIAMLLTVLTLAWILRPIWGARSGTNIATVFIAVVTLIGAFSLYGWLGPIAFSDIFNQQTQTETAAAKQAVQAEIVDDAQIKQMVTTLAAKLEANPNNPNGWVMLLRSYKVLGRYEEADVAYASAKKHIGETIELKNAYDEVQAARKRADKNRNQ
jgi:cytochrome c-type biogenesis protein CcmH/NrfG